MAAPLIKPILCPILVGRDAYLSAFADCIDEAAAGHGGAVLVSGEAGIGKSRLISEAGTYAAGCGFHLVTGHCFEQDIALPFAPLVDVLRTVIRTPLGESAAQALQPFASELLRVVPDLSDVFSTIETLERDASSEPEREKRRLVQAFTQFVFEIASGCPLFLCIE